MATHDCSICLLNLKDPVSIPCGHVYCMECLSQYVNSPTNETFTAFCPTCRSQFNMLTPDLTYLPKKYHPYIVSGVRRLYFDTTELSSTRKALTKAEARIKRLEKNNETLMSRCEKLMESVRVHQEGERDAKNQAEELGSQVERLADELEDEYAHFTDVKGIMQKSNDELEDKYAKLLKDYKRLLLKNTDEPSTIVKRVYGKKTVPQAEQEEDPDSSTSNQRTARQIKSLPKNRVKSRTRSISPLPKFNDQPKRARLST